MGMSTYAKAIIVPDEKYHKMYAVWEACDNAGIDPPEEVSDFFNYEPPNPNGMEVDIDAEKSSDSDRCADYYDVNIDDLPEGTTVVRFVISF